MIEVDSTCLVSAYIWDEYNSSSSGHIIDIIKELFAICKVSGIQHAHREGNRATYRLTRPSVTHKSVRVWSVEHPSPIGDRLLISGASAS